MAFNLYDDVADKIAVTSLTDPNPIRPPDLSPPGSYPFNIYFLDYASPFTYHRYSGAQIALNVRMDGPPDNATFRLGLGPDNTPPIDINYNNDVIVGQLRALRSVGPANVNISGNNIIGWTFEFVGSRAGKAQPLLNAAIVTATPSSTISVQRIQAGGSLGNEKQLVRVLQAPVATIGSFTEIGVGTTPGWATSGSGLSTTNVSQDFWLSPEYDIILEAILYLAATRSGSDGVTTSAADRNGTDGITADDGRGRSGTDGVTSSNAGRTVSGVQIGGSNATGVWGSAYGSGSAWPIKNTIASSSSSSIFLQTDVGRSVTGPHIPAGAVVIAVNSGGTFPGSVILISPNVTDSAAPAQVFGGPITLGAAVSTTFQSASAAFTQADVGHAISGSQFATGTTIVSVTNSTTCVLSKSPLSAGTGLSWTIAAEVSNQYVSASASFTSADIGRSFTGTNIPSGTVVLSVIDSSHITLSSIPTAIGTGLSWDMPAVTSNTYQSASAAFTSTDVGQNFSGTNIPSNTTIVSVTDSTHVVLSQTPTAVGTALAWTIQYAGSGAAGAPVVSRVQAGSSTLPEIQTIVFSRQLQYGSFTLQDGAGGANPLATVSAPLTAAGVQAALNSAYPGYGNVQVTQIAPTIIQITWGVNASQSLLLVNDTNVTYDSQVLRMVLVPAVSSVPTGISGSVAFVGGLAILNPPTSPVPISDPVVTTMSDGTKAFEVRQRFMQLQSNFSRSEFNSGGPYGTYLINEENMESRHGMVFWDRVWASLPKNRTETHQQMRPCIGVARTYLNGVLTDIQLFSVSISTWVNVNFTYAVGIRGLGIPPDGPAGTVIHFQGGGLGISQLLTYNGFNSNYGTFYGQFVQNWNRRKWKGDIWEQAVYVN